MKAARLSPQRNAAIPQIENVEITAPADILSRSQDRKMPAESSSTAAALRPPEPIKRNSKIFGCIPLCSFIDTTQAATHVPFLLDNFQRMFAMSVEGEVTFTPHPELLLQDAHHSGRYAKAIQQLNSKPEKVLKEIFQLRHRREFQIADDDTWVPFFRADELLAKQSLRIWNNHPLQNLGECLEYNDFGPCVLHRVQLPRFRREYETTVACEALKLSAANDGNLTIVELASGKLFGITALLTKILCDPAAVELKRLQVHLIDPDWIKWAKEILRDGLYSHARRGELVNYESLQTFKSELMLLGQFLFWLQHLTKNINLHVFLHESRTECENVLKSRNEKAHVYCAADLELGFMRIAEEGLATYIGTPMDQLLSADGKAILLHKGKSPSIVMTLGLEEAIPEGWESIEMSLDNLAGYTGDKAESENNIKCPTLRTTVQKYL